MKIMIWKELRENARWAALAFICLLLAEIFALSSGRDIEIDQYGLTLCSNTFLLVSAFGCAGIGAALGALQILPEMSRDQWASLLHRPVARHVIFLGKVAAGLLLYVLATGLPLLISVLYVAWPGQFPVPFVPGLAVPAASDLLLGTVFYFAALLLGLHRGRWFGARGAIALGVAGVLVLHLSGRWPAVLPLVAIATLYAAAWGAMRGSVGTRPWLSRLALGVVLLAGVQAALLLLGAGLRGLPQSDSALTSSIYTGFWISGDGTVFLQTGGGQGTATLTDLQGKVVTDERYVGNDASQGALYPYPFVGRENVPFRAYFYLISRSSQRSVDLVTGEYGGAELWYRLVGDRSYFVGYDKLSARCIGICDADGFKGADAIPRPFAREPRSDPFASGSYLFWVGPELSSFDFAERRMTPILHAGHDTIYGATRFHYGAEHPRIAVALESEMRILDADGAPLFTLPYGHEPGLWPSVSVTATEDFSRTFLQYHPSYLANPQGLAALVHLDVIDAQGRRIATYATPQTSVRVIPPTWRSRLADLANPPVPTLVAAYWPHADPADATPSSFLSEPGLKRGELAALMGLALGLSVGAVVWARRVGLSRARTGIWVAMTMIFGAAGFFAGRLAMDWPAGVRCPKCARRRPVRDSSCPHCHEEWEAPPATGSEIFEPAHAPAK